MKIYVEPNPGAMIILSDKVRLIKTEYGVLVLKEDFRNLPARFEVRHPSEKEEK